MKIEIYDPPMCCSTGICGPSVDERLVKINQNLGLVKDKYENVEIERYMITQQPAKFKENEKVYSMLKNRGKTILPITTFNGEIIKTRDYPSLEELEERIGAE